MIFNRYRGEPIIRSIYLAINSSIVDPVERQIADIKAKHNFENLFSRQSMSIEDENKILELRLLQKKQKKLKEAMENDMNELKVDNLNIENNIGTIVNGDNTGIIVNGNKNKIKNEKSLFKRILKYLSKFWSWFIE